MTHITDIHTHVLPGIDDGAPSWEICRQMLEKSAECGVTEVFATPHYLPWKKNAGPDTIREMCQKVQSRLQEETGISMYIYPGNEIYYHEDIVESLKQGKALTLAGSKYVLVEFSTEESFSTLCRGTRKLREAGYIPIFAHVERYRCIRKPDRPEELHRLGALFQMNVEILQAGIFSESGRWAKKALEKEQIQFLASDMHNLHSRPPMSEEALLWVGKRLNQDQQEALLYRNSRKILK